MGRGVSNLSLPLGTGSPAEFGPYLPSRIVGHSSIMSVFTTAAVVQSQFRDILVILVVIDRLLDGDRDLLAAQLMVIQHGAGNVQHHDEVGRTGLRFHLTGDKILDAEEVFTVLIRRVGHQVLVVADVLVRVVLVLGRSRRLRIQHQRKRQSRRQDHQGFIDLFHFHFSLNRCSSACPAYSTV